MSKSVRSCAVGNASGTSKLHASASSSSTAKRSAPARLPHCSRSEQIRASNMRKAKYTCASSEARPSPKIEASIATAWARGTKGRRSTPRASSCQLAATAPKRRTKGPCGRRARSRSCSMPSSRRRSTITGSISSSASGSGASSARSIPGSQTLPSARYAAACAAILFEPAPIRIECSKGASTARVCTTCASISPAMPCRSRKTSPGRRLSTSGETASRASSISSQSSGIISPATLTQSSIAALLSLHSLHPYAGGAAGGHVAMFAHVDGELEAVDAPPEPGLAVHENPLEGTVQTNAGRSAQCGAGACRHHEQERAAAVREFREPFPDGIAQRNDRHENQPADARAQKNVGGPCRRQCLADRNHQDSVERGARFGKRRRIEGAVVEDRDQAAARDAGGDSGR